MSEPQFLPPHNMSIAELNGGVKEALRFTLTHRTTLKHLRDALQVEGITIASKDETLRKFVAIADRHLDNVEDLFRLYHFFHRTTEGRLLRRPRTGANTAVDKLMLRLITPSYYVPHVTVEQDIVGSYLCYLVEDDDAALCGLRALCITQPSRGLFEFEEFRGNP
ncbi:MAG: hypothetical protein JSS20_17525, partial [Proteobacteria bacterium]|nr:hypothetical protein [Pseudomonadota bacterium]